MPDMTSSKPAIAKRPRPRYRGSSAARGYGYEHQKLRLQVLAANPICTFCGKAFATDMHHRDGNNRNTAIENLTGACSPCHDRHHARGG
jgi:5-methylcytosine-specific restriction endonuclease McrA